MVDRARIAPGFSAGADPTSDLEAARLPPPRWSPTPAWTARWSGTRCFGPLLAAYPFDSDDEAIDLANDAAVRVRRLRVDRDVYQALRADREIRASCVSVNDRIPIVGEIPRGGMKESGFGKDMSSLSFDEYAVVKHVIYDRRSSPLVFSLLPRCQGERESQK